MIKEITFFSPKDIEAVTGLSRENLRDAGFVLDDMDFGFILDESPEDAHPFYVYWLLTNAESYCVGCEHVELNGLHYYTVHHS